MNKGTKILFIGLFFMAMLWSCKKDKEVKPYFGYEYTRNDGEKVDFYLENVIETYGTGLFAPSLEVTFDGPEVIIYEIDEDMTVPCFLFKAARTFINIVNDTPCFYEGVRYHNSENLFKNGCGKYGHGIVKAIFMMDADTANAQSGWIEFHYGSGDVAFYLLYGIKYPDNLEITGKLLFYNRLIEEYHIEWRDWLRPAEENTGDKERWIDFSFN